MKAILKKEQIIGFKEFRLDAQKYINAVDRGASFLVMKRSRPAFRMSPVKKRWETFDFRDENGDGIPIETFIKALKASLKKGKK